MNGPKGKDEFVVQECLNAGTRRLTMFGYQAWMADPTARFPNLRLVHSHCGHVEYLHDEEAGDEYEEP